MGIRLQTVVAGIFLVLGLGTRTSDPYACVVLGTCNLEGGEEKVPKMFGGSGFFIEKWRLGGSGVGGLSLEEAESVQRTARIVFWQDLFAETARLQKVTSSGVLAAVLLYSHAEPMSFHRSACLYRRLLL